MQIVIQERYAEFNWSQKADILTTETTFSPLAKIGNWYKKKFHSKSNELIHKKLKTLHFKKIIKYIPNTL